MSIKRLLTLAGQHLAEKDTTTVSRSYRAWTFDGEVFTNHLTVQSADFATIVKTVLSDNRDTRAIVLTGGSSKTAVLIWVNGHLLPKPQSFTIRSPNENLGNDWDMVDALKRLVATHATESTSQAFCGWINANTGQMIPAEDGQPKNVLVAHPEAFGVRAKEGAPFHDIRILAERNGWCIVSGQPAGAGYFIQGSGPTERIVLAAVRALVQSYRISRDNLHVNLHTNEGTRRISLN